jgi:3-oxoadipate enol-lactonase
MERTFHGHEVDNVKIEMIISQCYRDFKASMATVPTIMGDLYVDDQGNDDEPVALLWPSLFNDHSMWRYQITPLRAAGWRTLALDPPGHGRSKGLERGFTMDECAEAALQVLDALNVHTPVVVLGTSWGGMIAPRIALRAPDRVRGMVLFNTTAESATPFDRAKNTLLTWMLAIGALDKVVDRMIVSLNFSPETRRRKPELGAELSRNFRSWNRRGVINTVRAVLVDRDSTLDALRNVKAPALVVSGKEDTILPSPHSRRIAEQLPKARHVEVPGAAHLVPLEAPDAANRLILDFVRDLPPL